MANQCIHSAEQFRKALRLPFDHLEQKGYVLLNAHLIFPPTGEAF
jgi:hypothetical protein